MPKPQQSGSDVLAHETPLQGMNYLSPAHVLDPNSQFREVSCFKLNIKSGMAYKMVGKKVIIN